MTAVFKNPHSAAELARTVRANVQNDPEWRESITTAVSSGVVKSNPELEEIYKAALAKEEPIWLRHPEAASLTTSVFKGSSNQIKDSALMELVKEIKGSEAIELYFNLDERKNLSQVEASAMAELHVRAGISFETMVSDLKKHDVKCVSLREFTRKTLGGDYLASFESFFGGSNSDANRLPDIVSIAKLRPAFDTMVSKTKVNNVEFARTAWVDTSLASSHSLHLGVEVRGSSHSVSPNLNAVPDGLRDKRIDDVKPAMVIHTHPGSSKVPHFSPADLEFLYHKDQCGSLVMLCEDGSGLIAVRTTTTHRPEFNYFSPAENRPEDINKIFDRHCKSHIPMNKALASAAKEVCSQYGLALYRFKAGSSFAEALYIPNKISSDSLESVR